MISRNRITLRIALNLNGLVLSAIIKRSNCFKIIPEINLRSKIIPFNSKRENKILSVMAENKKEIN